MILGVIFIVILLLCGLAIMSFIIVGNRLDKESKNYANESILAIVKDWNVEEARERSSPEIIKILNQEDLEKLFNTYKQLGKLKKYNGVNGGSNISFFFGKGKAITARYVAEAEFENGDASIMILLIKHEKWKILEFNITSKPYSQKDTLEMQK